MNQIENMSIFVFFHLYFVCSQLVLTLAHRLLKKNYRKIFSFYSLFKLKKINW